MKIVKFINEYKTLIYEELAARMSLKLNLGKIGQILVAQLDGFPTFDVIPFFSFMKTPLHIRHTRWKNIFLLLH